MKSCSCCGRGSCILWGLPASSGEIVEKLYSGIRRSLASCAYSNPLIPKNATPKAVVMHNQMATLRLSPRAAERTASAMNRLLVSSTAVLIPPIQRNKSSLPWRNASGQRVRQVM